MTLRDLVADTLRTLAVHKLRTFLTMFGIAWGIVSITLMVAAGEGLRVGQATVAEQFGKDIMIVFAGRTSLQAGGTRAGRLVQWTATDHLSGGYLGTAGGFCGTGRTLRRRLPEIQRIAVEPESAVLSGGSPGTHRIEGGGAGFRPPLLRDDDFEGVRAVSTADAFAMARRAAREEGLWSGPSSGANLVAALELARRLGPGRRVATILCDSGLKYLGGDLYA